MQLACLFALLLVHAWLAARVITFPAYPDENITQGVSARLWREKTLDTNWARVPDVARFYPGDQYNFSSAILAAQPIAALAALGSDGHHDPGALPPLRAASTLFTLAALLIFVLVFREMFGPEPAVLGVVLSTVSAQIFLDSLYARPEGFVLFCFALGLHAVFKAANGGREPLWLAIAGLCSGLMIAAKASLVYVLCQFAIILWALTARGDSVGQAALAFPKRVGMLASFAVVGFCMGVPSAVLDPAAYVRGVQFLRNQYGVPHAPFGRPFSPLSERAAFAMNQIVAVHGWPQLLFAALGAVVWVAARPMLAAAVVVPAIAFIAYFSLGPVYFERNFSFYLPLVSALCAYAIVWLVRFLGSSRVVKAGVAIALVALVAVPPALMFYRVSVHVVPRQIAVGDEVTGREEALAASLGMPIVGPWYVLTTQLVPGLVKSAAKEPPRIYRLLDLADPFSEQAAEKLVKDHGWRVVATEASAIADLKLPLLQLLHARAYRYLVPPHAPPMVGVHPFLGASGLCAVAGPALRPEGGAQGAFVRDVPTPEAVGRPWGSWVGHDQFVGVIRLGPFVPPAGSFLPVVTGPSVEGISATIKEAGSGRVLAKLPPFRLQRWVAWRLPRSNEAIEIEIRDDGRGWGQWIAIGTNLLREPGPRGC